MTLGERIRERRKALGIEVEDLAKLVGLSASTLYDLENGRSKSTTKLHAIARELKISADELETGRRSRIAEAATPFASHLSRPDPEKIAITTRALLVVLRRRNPKATLDLTTLEDAELFAEVYAEADAMPDDTTESQVALGAVVADLVKAREARRQERGTESEQVGGTDRGEAGRALSRS